MPNDLYARLGIRPFINCCGTRTVHGGSLMLPVVRQAMTDAASRFVNLNELILAAGRRIAELTGTEAALVTSGGAASLVAATAAAMTRGDPERMLRLPSTDGLPARVVMPKGARFTYDHAIRTTGAHVVEVADRREMAEALRAGTALVATIGTKDADLPIGLAECVALAEPHGIPVLIDAASEHLEAPDPYLARGASFVAYSGGKYLKGPQSTGLLLGRRRWIEAARLNAAPHHAIGRPMKVSKEEVAGLLAAVEFWASGRDHQAERAGWTRDLETIAKLVRKVASVEAEIQVPAKSHEQVPRLRIAWDPARIGLDGLGLRERLLDHEPRIMLDDRGATDRSIFILPFNLEPGEAEIVGTAIVGALAAAPPSAAVAPAAPVADLSGLWAVEIGFAAETTSHRLRLAQAGARLEGSHVTLDLVAPVSGSIAGDRLTFSSLHPYDGSNLSYAFSGTIAGGAMAGTVLLGTSGDSAPGPLNMREFGEVCWRARRLG
jgi:D-glucosaminate-6-phosphate ammonia-lyase